jgi:nucleoside-diphosphate-sugar epimerase
MSSHLITGVAGFVGSHLAKRLIKEGNEVFGVDSLDCGYMANIDELMDNPKFHFRGADIRDENVCDNINDTIDYVWHLAAIGEVYRCAANPEEALDVNVIGTLNILKQVKRLRAKHIFFADTSAEYDSFEDDQYFPTAEWMAPNTITPMGYYPITKMCASQFVRSFGHKNDIGTTLFRYTNIYGPSMNLDRDIPPVVGAFTSKLLSGEEAIIYGDGTKRRDFLHIDDLTDFHIAALKTRGNEKDTQTYNAGSGENHSILKVYTTVHAACKKITKDIPSLINHKPDQPDEAQVTLANIEKAKEELGWEPTISFKDGVEKTVKSLAAMIGNNNDS